MGNTVAAGVSGLRSRIGNYLVTVERNTARLFDRRLFNLATAISIFGGIVLSVSLNIVSGILSSTWYGMWTAGTPEPKPFWGVGVVPLLIGFLLLLALLAVVLGAYIVHALREYFESRKPATTLVAPTNVTQPHRGLIVLISPDNPRNPAKADVHAIKGHLTDNRGARVLEHLWLVCSPGSRPRADRLQKDYATQNIAADVREVQDEYSSEATFELISRIIKDALRAGALVSGLQDTDLVVDVTGGTKPMTVGAVLACTAQGVGVQYTSIHDTRGEPDRKVRPVPGILSIPGVMPPANVGARSSAQDPP